MDNDLTTISELPDDLKWGYWPIKWISKEEAKLIWPDRERLSDE